MDGTIIRLTSRNVPEKEEDKFDIKGILFNYMNLIFIEIFKLLIHNSLIYGNRDQTLLMKRVYVRNIQKI